MLKRGEASVPLLVQDLLGIDQTYIVLITDCKDAYKNKGNLEFDKSRFRSQVNSFMKQKLKQITTN